MNKVKRARISHRKRAMNRRVSRFRRSIKVAIVVLGAHGFIPTQDCEALLRDLGLQKT